VAKKGKTVRRGALKALTDLPGIGPTKAKWLEAAGIGSLDAVRKAPVDQLAHIRGVGYVLADRLKEVLRDASAETAEELAASATPLAEAQPAAEMTDAQSMWQGHLIELQGAIKELTGTFLAAPEAHGLKPKFLRELGRLNELIEELPVASPPGDATRRTKIAKHVKAIRTLLESAAKMDETSKTHQKVIRDKLRTRRKKLGRWA